MSSSNVVNGAKANGRFAQAWFPLTFVALLAWLDWIMHRSFVFLLFAGGAAVASILYRRELSQLLGIASIMQRMPPVVRALIRAAPPLLYFLLRGQGTSGAGLVVVLVTCAVVGAAAAWGSRIDTRLAGFYRARDRLLPFRTRAILVLIVALLVAFTVIHGSLADIVALIGGTTSSPQAAPGLTGRFFIGTLLSVVATLLLLRKGPTR